LTGCSVAAKFPNPAPGQDKSLVEKEWKKEFRRFYMRQKTVVNLPTGAVAGNPNSLFTDNQGARPPPKKRVTISPDIDDIDIDSTSLDHTVIAQEQDGYNKWKRLQEDELKKYMEDLERIRDEKEREKKAKEEELERLRIEKEMAKEEERKANEELLKIAKVNAEKEKEEKQRNRLKGEVRREIEEEEKKKKKYVDDQKKAVLDQAKDILDQAGIDQAIKDTVIGQLGDSWTPPAEDPGFKPWIRTIDPPPESRKTLIPGEKEASDTSIHLIRRG
jgi:hypothetical protein